MEDYEIIDDVDCYLCGHGTIHSTYCDDLLCEDGVIDLSEDDPINFAPREIVITCTTCKGYESLFWCPNCNKDLDPKKIKFPEQEY